MFSCMLSVNLIIRHIMSSFNSVLFSRVTVWKKYLKQLKNSAEQTLCTYSLIRLSIYRKIEDIDFTTNFSIPMTRDVDFQHFDLPVKALAKHITGNKKSHSNVDFTSFCFLYFVWEQQPSLEAKDISKGYIFLNWGKDFGWQACLSLFHSLFPP